MSARYMNENGSMVPRDNGVWMLVTDHATEVERLTAETHNSRMSHLDVVEKIRKESKWWMDECEKVSARMQEIAVERDAAVADRDGCMVALEVIASQRDEAVARAEKAEEALRELYKSLLIHEGEDIMGRVKGTWSSKAAEKACALIASSIANPIPMLDHLSAAPQPITVQAAPSDREKRLEEALKAYSIFESALVTDRGSWSGPTGHPFRTDELLDQFMECQKLRNAALAAASDKPQYAALAQDDNHTT